MDRPADNPRPLTEAEAREHALVAAIRRGDASGWAELLGRYQHRLYTICFRMTGDRETASDLTQDSMVKIIEGIGKYDGRSRFSTWVIRVTMNVVLSRLRSEKHRRHASLDSARQDAFRRGGISDPPAFSDSGASELASGERVEHEDIRRRIGAALLRVDAEHRSILILRDVNGLEYEHIAETLGVPLGTVKSRIFRAREALRRELEAMEPGGEPTGSTGKGRATSRGRNEA